MAIQDDRNELIMKRFEMPLVQSKRLQQYKAKVLLERNESLNDPKAIIELIDLGLNTQNLPSLKPQSNPA